MFIWKEFKMENLKKIIGFLLTNIIRVGKLEYCTKLEL